LTEFRKQIKLQQKLNRLTLYQLCTIFLYKCNRTYSDNQFYNNNISACWLFCCRYVLRQLSITSSILPKINWRKILFYRDFQKGYIEKEARLSAFSISYLTI